MHIPDSMLQNTVCTVTLVVGAASLVAAVHSAVKAKVRPSAFRFGAVTALILAAQMVNFPIVDGISGHLLGGVLAASLLGIPFGVLSVALVISVQAMLLGDGGVDAVGANIFNMAVLGAGVGGALYSALRARWTGMVSIAAAGWCAVMLAALAVSIELALGGKVALLEIAPAMLGVHALIGLGEALISVLAYQLLAEQRMVSRAGVTLVSAAALALFSPFASALPDGLQWVAAQQGLLPVQAVSHTGLPAGIAALFGVLVVFSAGWSLMGIMGRFASKRTDV